MKKQFSTKWIGSKQPRKQRKYRKNAPLHIRHEMLSANLSKELREKHKRRSFPLRKGDSVKIMRGEFNGKTGKINNIDLKKMKVTIEGIQWPRKDGTKKNVYVDSSKLQITELNLDDKKRNESILKQDKKQGEKKNAPNKK